MNHTDEIAMQSIIHIMNELYGYDFKDYSKASLKRRLKHYQAQKKLKTLADIIPLLINDSKSFDELLSVLSITVTEMFRDPGFYKSFSDKVIPSLKTYPYLKIWHAGCATGEEIYSMAILLHEHHYLDRTQLYATDFNPFALKIAKNGIYPKQNIEKYSKNYQDSGGKNNILNYFTEGYDALKINHPLQEKILFSKHNLATDQVFGEMEVILCRNVMIYFEEKLQNHVINLFKESLSDYGFLCLGDKENLSDPSFRCIDKEHAIYQKMPE